MRQWIAVAAVAAVAVVAWFVKPPSSESRPERLVADRPASVSTPHNAEPPKGVVVYVAGAVVHSGVYRLHSGDRVVDAVKLAGGLTSAADPRAVNMAALMTDGEEVDVKTAAEVAVCPTLSSSRSAGASSHGRRRRKHHGSSSTMSGADPLSGAAGAPSAPVDLNAASAADLEPLPGMTPALAARIVRFRAVNGRFSSVEGLLDVAGVTQRQLDTLGAYVAVR